jgi:hypothetical protein
MKKRLTAKTVAHGPGRHEDQHQRARAVRLRGDNVRRPPAMVHVPEVWAPLPQDIRRALFPMPAMLWSRVRLHA